MLGLFFITEILTNESDGGKDMGRFLSIVVSLLLALTFFIPGNSAHAATKQWSFYDRPEQYGLVKEADIPITMQDGVVLRADIYRPDAPGHFPVILTQTPYNKNYEVGAGAQPGLRENPYFVKRGYVHVVVDVRGTGSSQGTWDAFGQAEQHDSLEIVNWAAIQPWSSGKVGLWGGSYLGINQFFTAAQQPPALKAIFPLVPLGDSYRDIAMSGGLMNTAFIPYWVTLVTIGGVIPPTYTLEDPLSATSTINGHVAGDLSFVEPTLLSMATGGDLDYDGPFYHQRSPLKVIDKVKVPTFITGGLHDIFQRGEPLLYEALKKNGVTAKLLMGDWTHGNWGSGLPADGIPNLDQVALRWFDNYLKGINTNINEIPDVTQFELGGGHFEVQSDWPNPLAHTKRYYLRNFKALSTDAPAVGGSETLLQQPVTGVCSGSANQWTAGLLGALPCTKDNRLTELSEVTYTTPELVNDLKLSGPIGAEIYASTTAKDAVLSVRVTDVAPDGTSTEITAGLLAASFRAVDTTKSRIVEGNNIQPWHPFTKDSVLPVTPGEIMKLNIEIFPTNAVIKAGHRLRVAIGPSDFPHAISPMKQELNQLGGEITIYHDPQHPSFVAVPVVE
ncbi:CocE/NonD family hydrolase [Bacillus sp. V2I10]|uniref:CocE/NonD family hydrolase n=1 Tax=Bacillus sp. V2I10 TaxID=3042276 RepID=UPI00278200B9|nr:CocE/NonD family hydrolase [Bacillus sp. V2I10]MDQ0862265.1 putative acyl esterase [Bacillus sp. V2I10]